MGEIYTLRGHHIEILRKYIYEAGSNMLLAIMAFKKYGNFAGTAASKLDLMVSDSENKIRVIDRLDDICNANCPYRNGNSCQIDGHVVTDEEAAEFDKKFIEHFGLEKGRTYSVNELIKRIGKT